MSCFHSGTGRYLKMPWFVFMLMIPANLEASALVVPKYSSIGLPLIIGLLALGVLLGLLAYTIFLAFSTKEPMFIYFSVIMVLLAVLQTFAAFDRFLFSLTYNRVTIITHLLFITFLLFFETFFTLSVHAPLLSRINRISILVIAAYTVFFLLAKALMPNAREFHALLDFIRELFVFSTNIIFLYTIIRAIKWMPTEATLLLVAFIPPAVLTSVNALNIFTFMHRYETMVTFLMTYNQPIGLSLQAILFSLAMGNRYNQMKLERQEAARESEQLRLLDQRKTEFFMDMNHELRTPLTIILGMTDQLRQGKFGDSIRANDRVFQTIERNGLRLLRQVNHLLRIGKPSETVGTDLLPVSALLSRMIDEFSPIAAQLSIALKIEADTSSILEMAGEDFEAVVMNLLANALKFTKAGGSIHVTSRIIDDGSLCISVEDTGIGIEKADQELIFQRYHGIRMGNQMQTGLGLPLVKSILEGYGGSVALDSTPGIGSTFTLTFPHTMVQRTTNLPQSEHPLQNSKLYTTQFAAPGNEELPCSDTSSKPTILVVEDNLDMCSFICAAIKDEYRGIVAHSGTEGLALLDTESVQLIISDIMMPHMDGHAFLSSIKKRGRLIPFIFLTARDSLEEKIKSLEEGALHYLTKPFSAHVLLATIKTTLEHDRVLTETHVEQMQHGFDLLVHELEQPAKSVDTVLYSSKLEQLAKECSLSAREREIVFLLGEGKSDKEIAERLNLSVKTIANHNQKIYQKIGVNSRFELFAKLFRCRETP